MKIGTNQTATTTTTSQITSIFGAKEKNSGTDSNPYLSIHNLSFLKSIFSQVFFSFFK